MVRVLPDVAGLDREFDYAVPPELADRVRRAFETFEWAGSALEAEFVDEDGFLPITYREHWEVIRRIDIASGTSWGCR